MILCLFMACVCGGTPASIDRLATLAEQAGEAPFRSVPINLEGTVLWSSEAEGRVILHDETASLQLELHLPYSMPQQGERLKLEGACSVVQTRDAIILTPVPVVENDGLHALAEQSGTIHLEAGRHPVQGVWFNRTDRYGLEVTYEGPDIPRQRIPDADLWHRRVESGVTNAVNGLEFRCFEGQWWRYLPNFDYMPPVRSGVVDNFDAGVRTRDNHVGVQFAGYIDIPQEGSYTFYVRSDDGSRLFIGPSSLRITTLEGGVLPLPPTALQLGASQDSPEFQWSEIEGNLTAVYHSFQSLELELMTEAGRVRIKVADGSSRSDALRLFSRIRAVGVSRRIRNLDGNWVRGGFFVQSLEDIEQEALAAADAPGGGLPLLTSIAQIYQLGPEESAKRYPVKVRGVITSPMDNNGAVLQDASRGIYVDLGGAVNLQAGDYCEIEGTTGPYQFSQFIEAARVEILGAGVLPEPVAPSWDQLINGSLHCNYVELEGVVSSIRESTVALLTRGGRINVRLNAAGPAMPHNVLGATIRLRGCLRADWEGNSRRVVVGSIYLDQHGVMVVQPAPADPFRVGYKRVDDLLQFDPDAGALQRVRVYGVLIYKGSDFCCLMEDGSGLRFMPANAMDAAVGDRVDVAGFLELGGASPMLREARVRTTEQVELPIPNPLTSEELLQDGLDATLVEVEGVLLGISDRADRVALELQNGLRRFMVEIDGPLDADGLVVGCRLKVTGVYMGLGGNRVLGRPIDSFKLLLNNAADIVILSRPAWWTLRRLLNLVGLLAAVLAAALVWIKLLRRKVEQRTVELGSQIRKRQRAEHQRQIEEERARVAHDLHDDLGARITEVNMLASLVQSPETSSEERKKYAEELSDIALHMVTSLDEIVWAVNPRNDTVSSLTAYFGAYAQRFLELASINCGLDVADCQLRSPLDTRFRRQIFLAFKEALSNVVQHARAGKVWLRICVDAGELVVEVSDDGQGFVFKDQKAGADGLFNMKKRLKELGGQCSIESEPAKGTTVRLQAPIQKDGE